MDTDTTAPHVVVGIDTTPASMKAVTYAAIEAERRGAELHIVHATPGYGDMQGDFPVIDDGTLTAFGHRLLEQAATTATSAAQGLVVHTRLLSGRPVPTLVSSAADALVLVLGAERRSFGGRLWTGDVVGGAAARASCPVVVVAPEWDRDLGHRRIVVGLKSVDSASELLAAGVALAHEAKAELVVVHAWKLLSGYDDMITNRVDVDAYERQATNLIEPVLDDLRKDFPDVPVRIEVQHAQPALALVNASSGADRLLLARPAHGGLFHHLGAVTRTVLREAQCPVEILPSTHVHTGEPER